MTVEYVAIYSGIYSVDECFTVIIDNYNVTVYSRAHSVGEGFMKWSFFSLALILI